MLVPDTLSTLQSDSRITRGNDTVERLSIELTNTSTLLKDDFVRIVAIVVSTGQPRARLSTIKAAYADHSGASAPKGASAHDKTSLTEDFGKARTKS
jgi:hypothetical protein